MITKDQIVPMLLEACPEIQTDWQRHRAHWNDEEAGIYNDLAVFAHFIVNAFSKNETARFPAVFQVIENLLSNGTQEVRDAAGIGFLKALQNIASWRPLVQIRFFPGSAPIRWRFGSTSSLFGRGRKASWM
ncbi:MAG: DUF7674 family protein [Candidatus Acidiferrales bacterium]